MQATETNRGEMMTPKECRDLGVKNWYRHEAENSATIYHLCSGSTQLSTVSRFEIAESLLGGHQCNSCGAKIEWKYTDNDGVYPVEANR